MSTRQYLGAAGLALALGVAVAVTIATDEPDEAPPAAPSAARPERCGLRLEASEPKLPPPAPFTPPESRLVASAELPTTWLEKQIAERAPTTLASAKRKDLGAPGEVSYVVTRGPFSFELDGGRLWVRTPVGAQAEICKPIGPICPTYGSCTPRLGAGIGVPLMLDALEEGARVSLQVFEGCSIAGFDATSRIETQAKQRLAGVKARIDAAIPPPEKRRELIGLLFEPRPLEKAEGCLRLVPARLVQAPPKLDERLSLRFALEGELVHGDCAARSGNEPSDDSASDDSASDDSPSDDSPSDDLPRDLPIERGEVAEMGDVAVATAWPLAALTASFPPDERIEVLATAVLADRPVLVLGIDLDGEICGRLYVAARPVVQGSELGFDEVQIVAPADLEGGDLLARFESLRIPLPPTALALQAELMRIEAVLAEQTRDLPGGLAIGAEGKPAGLEVAVEPKGLRLVARRELRLVAKP